ncbi:MAG: class I SAM-dependent methyltransferase [bacterium]|nr:class I SAM-dependent methyltransferase [bacterium]
MKNTGERQIPSLPGTLENLDIKHTQRYQWASAFTHHKRVYDIACGTGYGSLLLEASTYTGFDNSAEAIEYANQYYATNESVKFAVVDACAMPSDIEITDVIVSFETIEHLKEPEAFLDWCSKHSQMLIISSPIRGSFGRSHFHLFEYRLEQFSQVLHKYFSKVTLFTQKQDQEIVYPCLPEDKGVAIGVCQP